MDIGVVVGGSGLGAVVAAVRDVANAGVGRAWLPQIFGVEALTAIAVAGREIPDIEFGTAVIPTYPRHPLVLAPQALTTSAAIGGVASTSASGSLTNSSSKACWGWRSRSPQPICGNTSRRCARPSTENPSRCRARRSRPIP